MADDLAEKLAYWRQRGAPGQIRPGRTDRRPIVSDDTGRTVGEHTHHWDGRLDATVRPDTVRVHLRQGALDG